MMPPFVKQAAVTDLSVPVSNSHADNLQAARCTNRVRAFCVSQCDSRVLGGRSSVQIAHFLKIVSDPAQCGMPVDDRRVRH
jgi:hypothetical protein